MIHDDRLHSVVLRGLRLHPGFVFHPCLVVAYPLALSPLMSYLTFKMDFSARTVFIQLRHQSLYRLVIIS